MVRGSADTSSGENRADVQFKTSQYGRVRRAFALQKFVQTIGVFVHDVDFDGLVQWVNQPNSAHGESLADVFFVGAVGTESARREDFDEQIGCAAHIIAVLDEEVALIGNENKVGDEGVEIIEIDIGARKNFANWVSAQEKFDFNQQVVAGFLVV